MAAAGRVGRHGNRDDTMVLLAYRHGLRVGELVSLWWNQVDLKQGLLTASKTGWPTRTHFVGRNCALYGSRCATTRPSP
jgi:site-specific recombinase XerD